MKLAYLVLAAVWIAGLLAYGHGDLALPVIIMSFIVCGHPLTFKVCVDLAASLNITPKIS